MIENKKTGFVSYVEAKPSLQKRLQALRAAGLPVEKLDAGYRIVLDGKEIFRAMNGSRGYLVRHVSNLFEG